MWKEWFGIRDQFILQRGRAFDAKFSWTNPTNKARQRIPNQARGGDSPGILIKDLS